jgi:hypothetical protein
MNQIVNTAPGLPAHLSFLQAKNPTASVISGISSGPNIHQIGIKAARWRIQDTQGGEVVVPNHYLDVIIVDANPNLSKVYYAGAYNPADTEAKAPDCYSDNGVAPSARASSPQCNTCAACPHNVWGSKVTPSGSQTKLCTDSKKVAVLLADNPSGPVYLLKVPAASLKNLYAFGEKMNNAGIPLPAFVTRLEFDTASDYPKIVFNPRPKMQGGPAAWLDAEQGAAVAEVLDSDEAIVAVGKNDQARVATAALPPVAGQHQTAATPITLGAAPAPAPAPALAPIAAAPAADPFAFANAAPAPAANAQIAAQAAQAAAPVAEKPKRTRKAKAAEAAPAPIAAAPSLAAAMFAQAATLAADIPGAVAPAAAVRTAPQPTNNALDDLINAALKA